ncbi:MAG: Maf family protein [Vicinamibacterales bacterium]|nr:Maf family protein [Vicinamibacterales bacterium]
MYHSFVRLVLASASPRRAELLTAAGFVFSVDPAETDESVYPGEGAREYALRVARDKAAVVSLRHPDEYVVAADTIVVVDGAILGKPRDDADAARMLGMLSGRVHDVVTAVIVRRGSRERAGAESTQVTFARLTPDDIAWYVGSGEPRDKAGGYAIQGLASRFATGLVGSYSNVVGLPVALVCVLLRDLGFREACGGRPAGPVPIDPSGEARVS